VASNGLGGHGGQRLANLINIETILEVETS